MSKEYFIKSAGKVRGPASIEKIKAGIRNQKINGSDEISKNSSGPWKLLTRTSLADYVQKHSPQVEGNLFSISKDELPHSLPSHHSKRKKKKTDQKMKESKSMSGQLLGYAMGLCALLIVGIGGSYIIRLTSELSELAQKSSQFDATSSVNTFRWCKTLPEMRELALASNSHNPVRLQEKAQNVQQALMELVGEFVEWEMVLVDIEEDYSVFGCYGNVGSDSNPILIAVRVNAFKSKSEDVVLNNYDSIIGNASIGKDIFRVSAQIESIDVRLVGKSAEEEAEEVLFAKKLGETEAEIEDIKASYSAFSLALKEHDRIVSLGYSRYHTPLYRNLPFEHDSNCPIIRIVLSVNQLKREQ